MIIVPASTPSGLRLFAVRADSDGMIRFSLPTLDQTRKLARLEFSAAPARLLDTEGSAAAAVDQVRWVAAAALASEQAGVAEAAKEMAVTYAKERIQFGQPIGQFQAIKHKCADLYVAAESAKSAAYAAAAAIADQPADIAEIVAIAASFCSEACLLAGHENIQIHGGIGFTWEYPAHLYYKRAKSSEFLFGDVGYHREILAPRSDCEERRAVTEEITVDQRQAARVRAEVQQWLSEHWSPGQDLQLFTEEWVDAGWARPTWPREVFGRDLPEELAPVVAEEFTAAGAPVPNTSTSAIAANAIKDYAGSADLLGPVLRKLLTGEYHTCLLYSEPGAGSDLAAVQTRADRDGEEWVVNGQKVWTSGGRQATHGLLAARTNWDVPKRRGITYFLLPMRQDGVEIRPIKQMTGQANFNEVFFTNARVPDSLRISAVEDGWRVLQTALAVERMMMGGGIRRAPAQNGRGEQPATRPADLVRTANQTGHNFDPVMGSRSPASTPCAGSGPGTPNGPTGNPT